MPLGCDLDVGVLYRGWIFDDAAHAAGGDGVVELPVGVTMKVETCTTDRGISVVRCLECCVSISSWDVCRCDEMGHGMGIGRAYRLRNASAMEVSMPSTCTTPSVWDLSVDHSL